MQNKNNQKLAGRTALVTGASGYLGKEISQALAEAGAHVLVNGRRHDPCEEFVQELNSNNFSAESAVFDITDPLAVSEFIKRRGAETPLHILVNNAFSGRGGTIETISEADFCAAHDVTVVAPHRLIKGFLPALRRAKAQAGDAAIVNISSMYGMVSPDLRNYDTPEESNPPSYGTSKSALIQLTRYTACQFAKEGIRCNAIAPGPFPTPATQLKLPQMIEKIRGRVPMGRIGSASEVGGPVVFLASPAASYVTGVILPVDGGWTAW